MALTASSMKSKIEAAIAASGVTVTEGQFNLILFLCQGIIAEIQANATVVGTVTGGSGAGGAVTGTVT